MAGLSSQVVRLVLLPDELTKDILGFSLSFCGLTKGLLILNHSYTFCSSLFWESTLLLLSGGFFWGG